MLRRLAVTLLLLGPISSVNLSAEGLRAERFEVQAAVLADRSLRVEETVVFEFTERDFTTAWRELPVRRTDGIVDVAARMDGTVLPEGTGPGQVEIRRGSPVKVTWHFAPTRGTHVFTLSYRLLGVAARAGDHDEVSWIALPTKHGYPIDMARVTLRVPPGSALASPLEVRPQAARVQRNPDGVSVTAALLDSDASIRVTLGIASDALAPAPPLWQADEIERSQRGPWLLLVAGAILAAGVGWLAAFSAGWTQPRHERDAAAASAPPDAGLPAALAARLAGRGSLQQRVAATVLELAARGVVRVEEQTGAGRLLGRGYEVVLVGLPASPHPHEAATLALLFGASPQVGARTTWRRLQQQVNSKGRRLGHALIDGLRRYGCVDPDRVAARRTLGRVTVFTGILALSLVAVAVVLLPVFGAWGFAPPAAGALVTILFSVAAARFSVLTPRGERDARAWRAFFRHLGAAGSEQRAAPPSHSWLALAAAAGLGHAVVKRAGPRAALPPWFRPAAHSAGGDGHEAFAALFSSIGASAGDYGGGDGGGAAAGAAAAGAAGGGSSGAS